MLSDQQIKVPAFDDGIPRKSFLRYLEDNGNRPEFISPKIFEGISSLLD